MPKGAFKDPWLSGPTSRWVWLCQKRIKIPNITDNVVSGARHAIFEGFLHEGTSKKGSKVEGKHKIVLNYNNL